MSRPDLRTVGPRVNNISRIVDIASGFPGINHGGNCRTHVPGNLKRKNKQNNERGQGKGNKLGSPIDFPFFLLRTWRLFLERGRVFVCLSSPTVIAKFPRRIVFLACFPAGVTRETKCRGVINCFLLPVEMRTAGRLAFFQGGLQPSIYSWEQRDFQGRA